MNEQHVPRGPHNATYTKKDAIEVSLGAFRGSKSNPRWKIWVKDKPEVLGPDQEERGGYFYDCFQDFEGMIDAISIREEERTYSGVTKKYNILYVIVKVMDVKYELDLGIYTNQYAQKFMERMAMDEFDGSKITTIRPYHVDKEGEKPNIGIVIYQNGKKIEFPKREWKEAMGVPEVEVIETDAGKLWVWKKYVMWFFNRAQANLVKGSEFDDKPSDEAPFESEQLDMSEPEIPNKKEQAAPLYPPKDEQKPPKFADFGELGEDGLPF